jgi:hypothetical protein
MSNNNGHLKIIVNEDGAAVLDTSLGTISTMNTAGAYIWQALERGECEEDIITDLVSETGALREVIERDMRDFLATLRDRDMLPC